MSDLRDRASTRLAFTIIAVFGVVTAFMGYRHGLCCADDASFAVVSKNVAHGIGYVLSMSYDGLPFVEQPFAPKLGMGPTSIIFVAAFIKLFGAYIWVPPVASAVLNSIFLCVLAVGLAPIVGPRRLPFALVAFLAGSIAINFAFVGFWYTQFGEIPAILATLTGYVWWCRPERTARQTVVSGIFLALGFLSKEMNAIYIFPIAAIAIRDAIERRSLSHGIALAVGLAMPVACFEIYRFVQFGSAGAYLENWREHLAFVSSQGGRNGAVSMLETVRDRMTLFRHQFSVTLWFALGCAVVASSFVKGNTRLTLLSRLVFAAVILHVAYWLFASNGWARYVYEAMIAFCFLLAIVIASDSSKFLVGACIVAIAVMAFNTRDELRGTNAVIGRGLISTRAFPTIDADKKTIDYLVEHSNGNRVYTSWWAAVANLEYLSPRRLLFQEWNHHPDGDKAPYLMVTNERFEYPNAFFLEALRKCGAPIFIDAPYRVYQCRPD
ncbi:hypothetical protein [Paraburkholderia bannensis]|uniref:hypothetical protein n=1 Tax=Paraburkholderia bannensis TaxID=765414 RepID=UPI002AB7755C|nr:hypothetical protein [Paraburkholderia bannensis]